MQVSSNTTGPSTITVSGVQWTDNQFNGVAGSYYLEIISTATPANTGVIGVINATLAGASNSTVTTNENLFAYSAAGDTIRIRKDVTIGDTFGTTNTAGILASDDPSTGDEVLIYDAAASVSYFYYTGSPGFPAGWYDSGFGLAPGVAAKVVIGPHQGVVVKRKASAAVSFTFNGAVKTGNTLFPVVNGLNVLGTVSAQGLTLGSSGLYTNNPNTGVKASDDPSTADEVTIYTGTAQTSYFYYTGSPGFAAGWYDSGFGLAPGAGNNVVIPPGTSFVLNRKGGVAFNWALPSPTSF